MKRIIYKIQTLFALTLSVPLVAAKFLVGAKLFKSADLLRTTSLNMKPESGYCFEFGVYSGYTINQFAELIRDHKQNTIYGFDSWKGFSESWTGMNIDYPVDHFARMNLPMVARNVKLIDGWIENTFPEFVGEHREQLLLDRISFIHIDTDTYTPSKIILGEAKPYFQVGTVIVFDELIGYNGFWRHEWRALKEELADYKYEWICIGIVIPLIKVAIKIVELPRNNS